MPIMVAGPAAFKKAAVQFETDIIIISIAISTSVTFLEMKMINEEHKKLERTKSRFVVVQQGFFRDATTKDLYATKPGFYPIEECLQKVNDKNMLILPHSAVTLIPRIK